MFKKMRQMNIEINELIQKNLTYYTLSFTTLIFAFLFFNISVISIYNIYQSNKTLNKSYTLSIYLNNNVSQNSIEKIEKNILSLDGVEKISYINKELAFKKLAIQLGLSNRGIGNPLLNSFVVKTAGEKNLNKAKVIIDEIDGVKEVVINKKRVTLLDEKIKRNHKLIIGLLLITFLPIKIMIFNIMHSSVVSQNHDIEAKLYLGMEKKEILRPYYFINNIKFISAAIIGSLIFLNLYEFIRNEIVGLNYLVSTIQAGIVVGIIIILVSLIFPFLSFNLIKVKR
ncbi:permease-like cell division protein FtsX [Psychrilyobacter sp.]|uniref:cell division protein FtsX n=1 Tax=Psychrilyobacter sp. TaxID=2586924 RepID=UPI00301B512E